MNMMTTMQGQVVTSYLTQTMIVKYDPASKHRRLPQRSYLGRLHPSSKIFQLAEVDKGHHGIKENREDLQEKDCASTRRNIEADKRVYHYSNPERGLPIRNTASTRT